MNLIKIFSNWGRSCLFEKAGFPCAINSSSVNHASFIESNVLLASSLEVSYFSFNYLINSFEVPGKKKKEKKIQDQLQIDVFLIVLNDIQSLLTLK